MEPMQKTSQPSKVDRKDRDIQPRPDKEKPAKDRYVTRDMRPARNDRGYETR